MEDKQETLESLREMQLKEEDRDQDVDMDTIALAQPVKQEPGASVVGRGDSDSESSAVPDIKRQSQSPRKASSMSQSPKPKDEGEEMVGGGVTLKLEPGKPPKLARTTSQKVERRAPQLFDHYEDKTAEATSVFTVITDCTYARKDFGITENALECDCAEEWDAATQTNVACGEDSDCINRATKMECIGDCGCGVGCQNQRFLRKQYANVSVIKTEKKGYGLRANTALRANDFIFEYIGEVIGEASFRRRTRDYDDEGIKHFYFMSLSKGEFVDATKKGNLGRFCNHSCNPNCYVDKWVVDDRLRMGIFAERDIRAGEELVFNYNVDRYGADPQPCYCGEPNCTGFIGGKTQTERATKLSNAVIEALGIDDADAWDTAVAKKPRKKKAGEDDEEYVDSVQPKGLDEEGVNKVMSTLMQCKEKWIAVKLLTRLQRADDEKVRNRVVRFHGYRILKTALTNFADDVNVCLQILDILDKMPRLTRNKIQDSKIEETVTPLKDNEDFRVASQAQGLLDAWSKLDLGYRIPRMKRDPNAVAATDRKMERRENDRRRSKSRSRSKSPPRIQAPSGPRSNVASRPFPVARPPPRFRPPPPPSGSLPPGWFEAAAANGSVYYYTSSGITTWQRPMAPAVDAPPPPPPKAISDQQMLQDLIKTIVANKKETAKPASVTPTPAETPRKVKKEEKWKSYPIDKQKKLYEGALQPHIMHVVGKYKHKLPKDDLKRWAKEFAKMMVDSDFKKGRVEDPTKVSDKQAKNIKKHAQVFFDKAVRKRETADKKKAEHRSSKAGAEADNSPHAAVDASPIDKDDDGPGMSDVDDEVDATTTDATPSVFKRPHDDVVEGDDEDSALKRQRTESEASEAPPPPPPPPPPPAADVLDGDVDALAPNGDVSGSFNHADIKAMYDATMPTIGTSNGAADAMLDDSADVKHAQHVYDEIMQTATPPTTGSPDVDVAEKLQHLQQLIEAKGGQ